MVLGACSDVGKVRKENEDSFYTPLTTDELKLFLIADGMGGQGHGKLASMMTIDEMLKFIIRNYDKEDNYLDINFKTICATAHNGEDGRPYLQASGVEVWDEDNNICEFITYDYTNYKEEE